MATLARMHIDIEARTGQFQSAMDGVSKKMASVGQRLTSTGRSLSAAVTLPLAAIGVAAVKMASDAEESANKFNVVMGDAADDVRTRLERLTETIPLTLSEMQGLAAGVQDLLVPMGVARDEAAGMSARFVELAGDIGSFNNVAPTDVIMAISSALAGSSEPMRRFGVDTREASLQQVALEQGIIGVGGELDSTTRALAVMAAIQRDSTDAMGDAARTSESTANQIRFFWREVKSAGETIGGILIPAVLPLIKHAVTLAEKFGNLDPKFQKTIVVVGGIVAAVGPLLLAFGAVVSAVGTVAAIFASPLLVPIAGVVAAVVGLVAVWVAFGDDILRIVRGAYDNARENFQKIMDFAEAFGAAVDRTIRDLVGGIQDVFFGGLEAIGRGIKERLDAVAGFFTGLKDTLVGNSIVPDMVNDIHTEMLRLGTEMSADTVAATGSVETAFETLATTGLPSKLRGVLNTIKTDLTDKLPEFLQSPIESAFGAVLSFLDELIQTKLPGKLGKIAGLIADIGGGFFFSEGDTQIGFNPSAGGPQGSGPPVVGPGGGYDFLIHDELRELREFTFGALDRANESLLAIVGNTNRIPRPELGAASVSGFAVPARAAPTHSVHIGTLLHIDNVTTNDPEGFGRRAGEAAIRVLARDVGAVSNRYDDLYGIIDVRRGG